MKTVDPVVHDPNVHSAVAATVVYDTRAAKPADVEAALAAVERPATAVPSR